MRSQSSSTHDPGLDLEYRKLLLAVFAMCAVTLTYEILKTITLSLQVFLARSSAAGSRTCAG
jgi:hypothetical protein